jgi:hypothetical protein
VADRAGEEGAPGLIGWPPDRLGEKPISRYFGCDSRSADNGGG